jgi:hypothetical protein
MVDGHIPAKKPIDRGPIFAIGLADFSTNTGTPSLHTSFGRHLTQKASQFLWCDMTWSSFINLCLGIVSRILGCWCRRILHQQKMSILWQLCGYKDHALLVSSSLQEGLPSRRYGRRNIAVATKSQMTNAVSQDCARTWAIIFAAIN